ncbi:MAG TPA: isocitrate lyase/phosphoenolpyruvate mutase family protein [Candidatus Acidoferrales bacterium]|nr:isocitrate lyase/phosphoenolpyruvate mutase family protein [Candidatus Acidoferrales bacterium]
MNTSELRIKAERLRSLHAGPRILVLCNVWDAAGARIVEEAGLPAVATSSAAIANSLGYPDGQRISREEMAAAVRRIARAVAVPVTADMESGYGPTPEAAAETVRAALEAGAVGLNLEDAIEERQFIDISLQCERIRAAREAGARAGVPIVINARTDVYLARQGEPAARFEHAVRRANAYREAGGDCLFVPGVTDAATIGRLAREITGPINILAVATTPPVAELERLGVRRVSVGSGPMRAAMALMRRIARELAESGAYSAFTTDTITYAEANGLFAPRPFAH